jgi:two-component system, NarL family, response regulator NreC
MRPRAILADDHVMVAEGLSRLLGDVADVVACVKNGPQLVECAAKLRPDLIVSDVSMPGMSGLDAMRQLKAEGLRARFIFLTVHPDATLAAEALRAGASGYLLKEAAGEELLDAIRAVVDGRTYVTPLIINDVVSIVANPAGGPDHPLTLRQREVLRLIAQGKRMKEIADTLNLSVRTVEDHKAQLMRTLGLATTADLVKFAIRQGIVHG